jgi:hypothetical protein
MPDQEDDSCPLDLRAALLERLENTDGAEKFATRLRNCGSPIRLSCTGCGEGRDCFTRCNWRCCPSCQRALAAATADRFSRLCAAMTWPLMVTWTAWHEADDDTGEFRLFRKGFSRLRAQAWWKKRVRGGVVGYEVSRLNKAERKKYKLRAKDHGWHFHGHSIIDCRWLFVTTPPPRPGCSEAEKNNRIKLINDEVNEQWSMAVRRKGGHEVHRVWKDENQSIGGAIHEVLKYSITGADLVESEHDILPVLHALEKAKLSVAFGSMFNHTDVKRTRGAPAMCKCGCNDWMPDFMVSRFFR